MTRILGDRKKGITLDEALKNTEEAVKEMEERERLEAIEEERKKRENPKIQPPLEEKKENPLIGLDIIGDILLYRTDYEAIKNIVPGRDIRDLQGRMQVKNNKIYGLKLDRLGLSVLHEDIGRLTGLQSLEMSFNTFLTIPDSVGKLVNLETLSMHYSKVKSLPSSIENIPKLKGLYLFHSAFDEATYSMLGRMSKKGVDVRY